MKTTTDVIVAGGGIIGLSSAWKLAHSGLNIILLEAARRTGLAASRAGAGILMPLYPWRHNIDMQHKLQHSISLYPQFISDLEEHTNHTTCYQRTGMLILDAGEYEYALQWQREHRQQLVRLTSMECHELQPQIHTPDGGLWMPQVHSVDNPALLRALRIRLQQLGVRIICASRVHKLCHDGDRVTSLVSSSGVYSAASYVLAAGAGSSLIEGINLQVRPVRGQMIALRAKPNPLRHIVLANGYYLAPRRNYILAGSTVEEAGFDNTATSSARTELMTAATGIMPCLKNKHCSAQWAGLRPGSVQPLTGQSQYRNLYLNTGHHRNGLALAPGSAATLAKCILQNDSNNQV